LRSRFEIHTGLVLGEVGHHERRSADVVQDFVSNVIDVLDSVDPDDIETAVILHCGRITLVIGRITLAIKGHRNEARPWDASCR
jgi:hypothetical protein